MTDPRGYVSPGQKLSIAADQVNWINQQMRKGRAEAARTETDSLRRVCIKIPAAGINDIAWPSGVSLSIGHAAGLPPLETRDALPNPTFVDSQGVSTWIPQFPGSNAVDNEAKLVNVSPARQWLDAGDLGLATEQFGVIEVIANPRPGDDFYYLTCIVGGVFTCRAIAFGGISDRLLGPPPIPANNNLKPLWRPYPLMAPVGTARVLAVGARWQVGSNPWPQVVDCLVSM